MQDDDFMWGTEYRDELDPDFDYAVERVVGDRDAESIRDQETLKLHRYRRVVIDDSFKAEMSNNLLEALLEYLCDEYGDPGDRRERHSLEDIEAAKSFVESVCSRYPVWRCKPDGHVETVDLLEWYEENAPELLEK